MKWLREPKTRGFFRFPAAGVLTAGLLLSGSVLFSACLDGAGSENLPRKVTCTQGGCPPLNRVPPDPLDRIQFDPLDRIQFDPLDRIQLDHSSEKDAMTSTRKIAADRSTIPPIDAAAPARTETATFALG